MAWSIFTQGGGDPAAAGWADQLLSTAAQEWGVPVSQVDNPSTKQFVFDWEKAEGGGGAYNPLNQGPDTTHPGLSVTGEQYGGGAADYASVGAGIQGAIDYLNMPNFSGIKQGLLAGSGDQAKAALIASPWAGSHYGGGANFPSTPFPGTTSSVLGTSGTTAVLTSATGGGAAASTAPTSGSQATAQDFMPQGAVGTLLQYLDGFLNPRVSAVPGIINLLTDVNGIVGAIMTLVDRGLGVVIGAGMVYVSFKILSGGGGRGIVTTALSAGNVGLRAGELGIARRRESRLEGESASVSTPYGRADL